MHDRLGEAQRFVGHYAPDQVRPFDLVEQFGHAIVKMTVHRAVLLIPREELETQFFELGR